MKELLNSIEPDMVKFYEKENTEAGVRLRKNMQEVKDLAQKMRMDISTKTKEIKASRKKVRDDKKNDG